jgi:hypothetical protein
MNGDILEALAIELASERLQDEGIEAARNACVAGASIAAAAITAAAYYDNPLTGIVALAACMVQLGDVPLDAESWARRCARCPTAELPFAPGFGYVTLDRAAAVADAAARLLERARPERALPRLGFWLEQRQTLSAALGPLNAAGLAALVFLDREVPSLTAQRWFMARRIEVAMAEAELARAGGLGDFPFFSERHHYEGRTPSLRTLDLVRLMREVGLD